MMEKCGLALALVLAWLSAAVGAESRSLALFAEGERAAKIVAIVEAELSKNQDIVLVDRREIDKVVNEQRLALSGLMDTETRLTLGPLLKCDIVVFIISMASNKSTPSEMNLIMYDTVTGARLCDQVIAFDRDLKTQSKGVLSSIRTSLHKHGIDQTDRMVRPLSIMAVSGHELPENARHLPEIFPGMLERTLLQSSEIIVLERKRIDAINKERMLSGIAADKLLASAVRVDIDILNSRRPEDFEVRASLSDVSGKLQGVVSATGRIDASFDVAIEITDGILRKLNMITIKPDPFASLNEVSRLMRDWETLHRRREFEKAGILENAALALAETALARHPDNMEAQKYAWQLLSRRAHTFEDPWTLIAMLERYIELCEKWPAERTSVSNPTNGYITRFRRLLYRALDDLKALPWQENAKDERLRTLRRRFGRWNKNMAKAHWQNLTALTPVELWADDIDEMLEDAGKYMRRIPIELELSFHLGRYGSIAPSLPLVYPIETYAPEQKRKLLSLYQQWECRRPDATWISAAILVNTFPDEFDHPGQLIEELLLKALETIVKHPYRCRDFVEFMKKRLTRPWPSPWTPFQPDKIRWMASELRKMLEEEKIIVPCLYDYLDEHSPHPVEDPGYYLRRAITKLESEKYGVPAGAGTRRGLLHVEPAIKSLSTLHKERHGCYIYEERAGIKVTAKVEIENIWRTEGTQSEILTVAWQDSIAYILIYNTSDSTHEIRQIDLRSGSSLSLGRLEARQRFSRSRRFHFSHITSHFRATQQMTVGARTISIPTPDGLCVFWLDGGSPQLLSVEDGLPSNHVTAACEMGDALYIGCHGEQEGYVVRFHLGGAGVEILANSGRQEKRSVLDATLPYYVETLASDPENNRIFIVAVSAITKQNWLFALDHETGQISHVYKSLGLARQLRRTGPDQYLVRNHTNMGHRNCVYMYWGYAVWDSSAYDGAPLHRLEEHLHPLMGMDPLRYNPYVRLGWTSTTPSFTVRNGITPSSTAHMARLGEKHLVSSDETKWQLIERSDIGQGTLDLPLLDGRAPISVDIQNATVVACTIKGLWKASIVVEQR